MVHIAFVGVHISIAKNNRNVNANKSGREIISDHRITSAVERGGGGGGVRG